MSMSFDTVAEIVQLGQDIQVAKWYYTASSALLAYDYCLTIDDEIMEMWMGRRSSMFYLFVLNRYGVFGWSIVTLTAYFSPLWTVEVCRRFVIVEWFQALYVAISAEMVLLFRIYALTHRSKHVAMVLICIMLAQCSIVVYAMGNGSNMALPLPNIAIDVFHICVLFSDPRLDTVFLALSVAFDTIVFALTLYMTINEHSLFPKTILLQTIQQDGAVYFFAILSGNIAWMVMALCGRPGLKFVNSQPGMILTSIMINRLTISLRKADRQDGPSWIAWTSKWNLN